MSDSKNRGSVFGAMRQNRSEPTAPEEAQREEATPEAANVISILTEYAAFASYAPRGGMSWLRVYFSNDGPSSFPYFSIKEIFTPSEQTLGLMLDTGEVIMIEGRNLTGLHDAIEDDRARSLVPFDEKRFARPADDAPYIERINRIPPPRPPLEPSDDSEE